MDTPIRMKSRNIEKDVPAETERYDDEIMCVGWNPSISMVQKEHYAHQRNEQEADVPETPAEDQELYLHKIYTNMR